MCSPPFMRDDLTGLLEKADLALGSAAGVIDEGTLTPLIESVRAVRTRLAYPDDILAVALAGGTGSGKSSLFNALAGDDLVETGGIRPTTSQPSAAVPGRAGSRMDGYLDRMGVEERHRYDGEGICLLDLPDTDSLETSHRYRVDRILPLVDVVVWVIDPEKYRDARLHLEYLKPMAAYSHQFLFVLNQIDRLDPEVVDEVVSDLHTALTEDGIDAPTIIEVSAAPPVGPPIGLGELADALEAKRAHGGLFEKLLSDLAGAGEALQAGAGSALDFDALASRAVEAAVRSLGEGDTAGASRALTGVLDALVAETEGDTTAQLERMAADVPSHVARISAQLGMSPAPPPRRRWFRRVSPPDPVFDVDRARSLLTEATIRPARAVVAKRALALASIAEMVLEVERLRRSSRS